MSLNETERKEVVEKSLDISLIKPAQNLINTIERLILEKQQNEQIKKLSE